MKKKPYGGIYRNSARRADRRAGRREWHRSHRSSGQRSQRRRRRRGGRNPRAERVAMSVYKPKYRDPKSGELVEVGIWWYEFSIAGKRVRESANTPLKTIAREAEQNRRRELEKTL